MLLDAGALLAAARDRAGLSQAELARLAGTSQAALCRYERGTCSPGVATLVRLLAAADLQLRCAFEPWQAQLSERVEAFAAATPSVNLGTVERVARSLAASPGGPVRWALDGLSALACHGLGPGAEGSESLVLAFGEPSGVWMSRQGVRGNGDERRVSWVSLDADGTNACLGTLTVSLVGVLTLRVVDALPTPLLIVPPGGEAPVPVLSLEAVEDAHPHLRELLAGLRARRERDRRTVGG